jgi:hypothetical protein
VLDHPCDILYAEQAKKIVAELVHAHPLYYRPVDTYWY